MKYLSALAVVSLLIAPSAAAAQQISPNPNPTGNTITVDSTGAYNQLTFQNRGTISVVRNAMLHNQSGGAVYNYATSGFYNYGTLTNDGQLNNYGEIQNNDGTLTNNNLLTNDNLMSNAGSLVNNKTFYNNGGGNLVNNGMLTNSYLGKVTNEGELKNYGTLTNAGGSLVNDFGSTLTNENGGTLTNQGMMSNAGTLSVHGTMYNREILSNDNTMFIWRGATLLNTGSFKNEVTLNHLGTLDTTDGQFTNYGTLNGSGSIKGSYTDHGHTKPGNSAGVMTIDGDYLKMAGSKEIELGGLFDGGGDKSLTEHDWLNVTGNVELAGTLDVKLLGGFELHRGNVFNFLRVGGTLNGQYDGLDDGDLVGNFGGQDLFITYGGGDGNDVALFTNAVPEPTTVLIWSMLAGVGMTVRRRR